MLATKVVVSVFRVESVFQRGPPKQNEPGSAMVQQQCIGSAVKGIDSAKEKVPPCPTAVRLPQLFTKKSFRKKKFEKKIVFSKFLVHEKRDVYAEKHIARQRSMVFLGAWDTNR